MPPTALGPMFLDPLSRQMDDGLEAVRATPADEVRDQLAHLCPATRPLTPWVRDLADQDREAWKILQRALHAGYDGLLSAHWGRIRTSFDAEQAWRTRLLARHGIRTALASLAPGGRWEGTTLVFDCPERVDVRLRGHGLVLLPSALWTERPLIAHHEEAPSILIYPAAVPLPLIDRQPGSDPLGSLLGRTRAAVLGLLTRQLTTSDVARELGISKAAASQHTKALREARLITTHREGKAVWHTCSPMGIDFLAAAPPC
ncbi:ArsR/SmtB family transcription factor [Streptomyces hiroshimensis]|uniref:ArsR/SmtB family transcription factor n=1 Tax=Streptomyces hiroshimensis TaxID=66424 RepID=UPI001678D7E9|nr:helix-turn-helix domain-containing protein [Streptomyces hiroshimensis]